MSLDTGNSFYATTHKDVLQRVGLWGEDQEAKYEKESFVASGAVKSWSALMTNLTIFGVPVKESVWDVIDRPAGTAESGSTVGGSSRVRSVEVLHTGYAPNATGRH